VIPNNILKSKFVAILPTNVKKNTRTAKFFIRFLSVCVLFGGQKYEKQALFVFEKGVVIVDSKAYHSLLQTTII
jgi:hypothetical protein